MAQFVVLGTVPYFEGDEFNLPADNGPELEAFYKGERIATTLHRVGAKPVITVRGRFARRCRSGKRVRHTIESVDRKSGRGIKAVDMEIQ